MDKKMDDKNYTLTEERPEAEVAVEEDAGSDSLRTEIRIKKRPNVKHTEDHTGKLIAILSAMVFLFTVIVVTTLSLINSSVIESPIKDVTTPGGSQGDSPIIEDTGLWGTVATDNRVKPTLPSNANAPESTTLYMPQIPSNVASLGDITSTNAILINASSGQTVAGLEFDESVPIASMTKVMTLIVACDMLKDSDMYRGIKISYDLSRMDGYSTCYINRNNTDETVYVIDLLYGLILESGADCAYGLAEALCGSEDKFVKKMNKKAEALGMTGTEFSNCVGKDDAGKNVSTMRDVAAMFAYALKNPLCYEILTASTWEAVGVYGYLYGYGGVYLPVKSIVHAGVKGKDTGKVSFLGGKSGQEINAGYCLVSFGEANGMRYICVTAGHKNSSYTDTAYIYKNYVK